MDIAAQIMSDIRGKLTRKQLQKAEKRVLNEMDEIKNQKTKAGESPAKNGRYNNTYSKQYADKVKGGRRSPVTMRRTPSSTSIERTTITTGRDKSTLKFKNREKGVIFNYHQTGTARGGKYRQIYPENDNQVPKRLDMVAEDAVYDILRR